MRFPPHHILDGIFTTWGHVALLRALADSQEPCSGRALARTSRMTHRAALKSLGRLENLEIVRRDRRGRSFLFSLNEDHRFVRTVLPALLAYEQEHISSAAKLIRKELTPFTESLILRRPLIPTQARPFLEIEICVILRDRGVELELTTLLPPVMDRLRRTHGIRILPLIMTEDEFRLQVGRPESPASHFVREGTVIAGKTFRELTR